MAAPGYQGPIAGVKCGAGGLNANQNPSNISLKNVIQAEGVVFRQDDWRKEPGTSLFGTIMAAVGDPADKVIVAITDWHPTESIQRIVSLRGDGITYFTAQNPGQTGNPGAFASTSNNSGSGTRFGLFVNAGATTTAPSTRKLFLFRNNKGLSVTRGDETDVHAITGPAADWISGGADAHPPICGVINGGGTGAITGNARLWAAGNDNNPHMLYASNSANLEIFNDVDPTITTNSQVFSIFPGVGERIYSLRNYKGFVIVFKYPRGIFIMDARDPDPANWQSQQVTDQVGICQSPYAAVQLENDVLFLGSDGQFYLLSAVIGEAQGQNNMQAANLGMDLEIYQFLLDAFNRNILNQIQSVYQPFWQTATFTIPSEGSLKNNTRMVWEFNSVGRSNGEPRFSYSYRDFPAAIALWRDPADFIDKPLYGDYLSNIILMEQDARNAWNATPYPWRLQTPFSNYGEFENQYTGRFVEFANRNKLWQNLEVEYIAFTDATVTVTVFVDGLFKSQFTMKLKSGGRPLGFSDTDPAAFVIGSSLLAGGVVRSTVSQGLHVGSGRRISFLFENQIAGQDFAFTNFYVGFNVSDTTQTPRNDP